MGLVTVIEAEPAVAIRVCETAAVSCDEFTKVVGIGVPFQLTFEPETKFEPFTVSGKSAPPGATAEGTRGLWMRGTGLFAAVAVRVKAKDKSSREAKILMKRRGDLAMFTPGVLSTRTRTTHE